MKSVFQPKAAFRVKPQLRVELYRWMFEFGRRCTKRQMLKAGNVLEEILAASMIEYRKLFSDPAMDCEWQDNGMLFVFRNDDEPAGIRSNGRDANRRIRTRRSLHCR